jgi:CDGSH-type Zn-finger protein
MADKPNIAQKLPYIVNLTPGTYYWCACGRSAKQPFCDGSHKGTDITPHEFTLDRPQTVILCGCKHTADKPFCDGAHAAL